MSDSIQTLQEILRSSLDRPISVQPDEKLGDAGVDSLDMYTFLLEVEERLGVRIPDEKIPEVNTLQKLSAYIAEHAG
jgi:acyl carrier protein